MQTFARLISVLHGSCVFVQAWKLRVESTSASDICGSNRHGNGSAIIIQAP